jgi:hypothetical protein
VLVGELGQSVSPARHDTPSSAPSWRFGRLQRRAAPQGWEYALIVLTVRRRRRRPRRRAWQARLPRHRARRARLDAAEPTRVVLLGGEPFAEPLKMWWNFVGRSRDDITAAYDAWQRQDDRFGRVPSALPRIRPAGVLGRRELTPGPGPALGRASIVSTTSSSGVRTSPVPWWTDGRLPVHCAARPAGRRRPRSHAGQPADQVCRQSPGRPARWRMASASWSMPWPTDRLRFSTSPSE